MKKLFIKLIFYKITILDIKWMNRSLRVLRDSIKNQPIIKIIKRSDK